MKTDNIVYVSVHATDRVKERCGISKKRSLRMAELAVERGQNYTDTKGSVRKWLDHQIKNDDRQIYVYGDKAFIFSKYNMVLITVLQIPAELVRCNNNNRRKAARAMQYAVA